MKISAVRSNLGKVSCDLLVVNLFEGVVSPGGATGEADKLLKGLITALIKEKEITGKLEDVTVIHCGDKLAAKRIAVVGLGKSQDFDLEKVRRAAAAVIKKARQIKAKKVATIVHGTGSGGLEYEPAAQALVEGTIIGAYKYEGFKTEDKNGFKVKEMVLVDRLPAGVKKIKKGAAIGEVLADAVNRCRDLVNNPSNTETPVKIAGYAAKMSKKLKINCRVLDPRKLGMKLMWGVSKGSDEVPKVLVMQIGAGKPEITLIGKGITFDSGGISLKPPRNLDDMKMDMAGAAAVIETMGALKKLGIKKNIRAIVPLSENMPGSGALKPGDILTALSGKTVEIISTDAEGRLILADAITYAKKLGTKSIIDVATLTGGCISALGDIASGIMGNDQKMIDGIIEAGKSEGEKMWQLPLYDEYKKYLKSFVADMMNCTQKGKASASVGGIFLANFVGDTPWVHLDIAGTAFLDKPRGYLSEEATGAPIRTLVEYIKNLK